MPKCNLSDEIIKWSWILNLGYNQTVVVVKRWGLSREVNWQVEVLSQCFAIPAFTQYFVKLFLLHTTLLLTIVRCEHNTSSCVFMSWLPPRTRWGEKQACLWLVHAHISPVWPSPGTKTKEKPAFYRSLTWWKRNRHSFHWHVYLLWPSPDRKWQKDRHGYLFALTISGYKVTERQARLWLMCFH